MAIYRTISLTFWTDTKIVDEFSPEDKYFYLYLLTNPHTNLCGCYEISKKQMSTELGYSVEALLVLLERFEKKYNLIRISYETNEILLLNWHKYNWTASPKFRKPLKIEIEKIKNKKFKKYLVEIENGNETYRIDTNCSDTTVSVSVTDTVSNKDIYGEFKNVKLSKEEYQKLEDKGLVQLIETLSSYMASKGKKYKNHYATILNWSRREDKPKQKKEEIIPHWLYMTDEELKNGGKK